MKNFFDTVKSSIYGPEFYNSLKSRPVSSTFKYFFVLVFFVALVSAAVFSSSLVPAFNFAGRYAIELVKNKYPADLKVTIKDGVASAEPDRPYFLELPPEIFDNTERARLKAEGIENLAVIDTKENFSDIKRFAEAKTMFLLAKDNLVFRKESGVMQIQSLKGVPETVFTKAYLESLLERFSPFLKLAAPLIFIFAVAGFFTVFVASVLVLVLVAAFLIWLIAKIMKRDLSYKKSYQVGLHAVTLLVVADLILFFFGYTIPFFYAMAITVIVWLINVRIWEKETPQPAIGGL